MPDSNSKNKKASIKILKDGPYLAKGVKNFKNSKDVTIPSKPVMTLCRCGKSSNKPFCDGTHTNINFNGDKDKNHIPHKVEIYKGEKITIYDNRSVCSHRGYCTDELPSVWRSEKEPWIDPDGASVEEIIKICEKCPSGALSYSLRDGERIQDVKRRDEAISIAPRRYNADGPYDITGGVEMEDLDGASPESKEHYALCRCGASKNKPFCSGEHWYVKFIDNDN